MNSRRISLPLASLTASLVVILLAFAPAASHGASPTVDEHGHGPVASQVAKSPTAQPKALPDADAQMKKMQEIHERMMAAKTPEERAKLMEEQMEAMQQGMAMMNAMKHSHGSMGSNGMRHDMMEKRMDMMQMMMTMMMDRESVENAPAAR
jgi:hypothetical protein